MLKLTENGNYKSLNILRRFFDFDTLHIVVYNSLVPFSPPFASIRLLLAFVSSCVIKFLEYSHPDKVFLWRIH